MSEKWQDADGPLRWAIGKAFVVLLIGVVSALMISWSDQGPATGRQLLSVTERSPDG